MKKLLLVILTASCILSCSTEDNSQDTNLESSLKIGFKSTNKSTNKNVKRGILPIEIDSIRIIVAPKSNLFPTNTYDFGIANNEDETAENDFVIKNFSQTEVEIYAYTILKNFTGNIDEYASLNKTTTEIFNEYNARKPFMGFVSLRKKITAVAGINTPVTIELFPDGYREISIFELSQELKDKNYTAKVGGTNNALVTKTNNAVHYKNLPTEHYDGSFAPYIGNLPVEIYDETGKKVASFNIPPDWSAKLGESTNTIYTITSDKIPAANQLGNTILAPVFKSERPINKEI